MKLRNKKTGEMGQLVSKNWNEAIIVDKNGIQLAKYNSLTELNEEWEDYEEPKEWWYIDIHGPHKVTNNDEYYQQVKAASKEIGNYFDTREEAELAVRKLKAWKRLKDKGFRFDSWDENHHNLGIIEFSFSDVKKNVYDFEKDLDLLFCTGGEE